MVLLPEQYSARDRHRCTALAAGHAVADRGHAHAAVQVRMTHPR